MPPGSEEGGFRIEEAREGSDGHLFVGAATRPPSSLSASARLNLFLYLNLWVMRISTGFVCVSWAEDALMWANVLRNNLQCSSMCYVVVIVVIVVVVIVDVGECLDGTGH